METTAKTQGISWGCRVPFDFIWDSSSHIMCVKRFQSAFYFLPRVYISITSISSETFKIGHQYICLILVRSVSVQYKWSLPAQSRLEHSPEPESSRTSLN